MFVQILMEKIVFDVIRMSSSAVLSLQKRGCEFKVESIPTEILAFLLIFNVESFILKACTGNYIVLLS